MNFYLSVCILDFFVSLRTKAFCYVLSQACATVVIRPITIWACPALGQGTMHLRRSADVDFSCSLLPAASSFVEFFFWKVDVRRRGWVTLKIFPSSSGRYWTYCNLDHIFLKF